MLGEKSFSLIAAKMGVGVWHVFLAMRGRWKWETAPMPLETAWKSGLGTKRRPATPLVSFGGEASKWVLWTPP